ncbi:MAG: hypothetical protein AAFU80_20715 [Pseudomonadota bacterium]
MNTVGLRPAALGPGEPTTTQPDRRADQTSPPAAEAVAAGPGPVTEAAVTPPAAGTDTPQVSEKKVADERPMMPERPSAERALGIEEPPFPAPTNRPAGPLKTFAQVPTEVMEEVSRRTAEEIQAQAKGVPDRNDPTPMPASPQAIGPSVPYNAA